MVSIDRALDFVEPQILFLVSTDSVTEHTHHHAEVSADLPLQEIQHSQSKPPPTSEMSVKLHATSHTDSVAVAENNTHHEPSDSSLDMHSEESRTSQKTATTTESLDESQSATSVGGEPDVVGTHIVEEGGVLGGEKQQQTSDTQPAQGADSGLSVDGPDGLSSRVNIPPPVANSATSGGGEGAHASGDSDPHHTATDPAGLSRRGVERGEGEKEKEKPRDSDHDVGRRGAVCSSSTGVCECEEASCGPGWGWDAAQGYCSRMRLSLSLSLSLCVCVCVCACVHLCVCACVHLCVCACVHICVCVCVPVCSQQHGEERGGVLE